MAHRSTLLTAVLTATVVATPAQAAFTPSRALLSDGYNVAAAGNRSGLEAFAWVVTTSKFQRNAHGYSGQLSYIRARLRLPDGHLGRARTISRNDQIAIEPQVAVDARGGVTAVWAQAVNGRVSIVACYRPAPGRFGPRVVLGRSASFRDAEPKLAVAADGSAIVMWKSGNRLRAVHGSGGRFSPPQNLPNGHDMAIAFGPHGGALAAWSNGSGTEIDLALARRGHGFGTPGAISPGGSAASQPAIAIGSDGTAVIAWRGSPPAGGAEDLAGPIYAVTRDPRGTRSQPQAVSAAGKLGRRPELRVGRDDEAILVWQQWRADGTGAEIAAATRAQGKGLFGAPVVISQPDEEAADPSLALDQAGNAVVVYRGAHLDAAVRPAGGAFGPPVALSSATTGVGPPLAFAAGAGVTVVWPTIDGTRLSDWRP
jgi:hypothetical protein